MLYKAINCLSCAHRFLLRESLPHRIYYGQGTEGRGNYDVGELNYPCTQHKFLVTESVWEEKPKTKQSRCMLPKVIPPVYRTNEQNWCSVVLLLTVPTLLWPSLNPAHNFQNQSSPVSLTFSCFSVSISAVFLTVPLTHAELSHLLLMAWYFTHMPPPWKIPWATWFTIYSNLAMCLVFCVVAPTDVNPLFHKGSQLPFSLKARWLWHLPISEMFNPT